MRIIDFHTHVYPEAIARKAADNVRAFYDGIGNDAIDGRVQTLLERGKEAGITNFVLLPVATKPDRTRHINEFIIREANAQPCFTGFGTVHAAMENLMEEVDAIEAMGLKGIKIHPDCQHFNIDDPRLFPLYEHIQGRLPMMMHLGDENYDYSHPARLRRVLELFPKLQVCAAHFGGHTMYETAKEYLSDTQCIMDISSTLMFLDPKVAENYINHYGAERLAFGSDYPVFDPVREMDLFLALDLTDDQKEQIAWKTATRFLNL